MGCMTAVSDDTAGTFFVYHLTTTCNYGTCNVIVVYGSACSTVCGSHWQYCVCSEATSDVRPSAASGPGAALSSLQAKYCLEQVFKVLRTGFKAAGAPAVDRNEVLSIVR
jgi:hypothetical protein